MCIVLDELHGVPNKAFAFLGQSALSSWANGALLFSTYYYSNYFQKVNSFSVLFSRIGDGNTNR